MKFGKNISPTKEFLIMIDYVDIVLEKLIKKHTLNTLLLAMYSPPNQLSLTEDDIHKLLCESSYDDTYSPTSEISIVDHIIFEVENKIK